MIEQNLTGEKTKYQKLVRSKNNFTTALFMFDDSNFSGMIDRFKLKL